MIKIFLISYGVANYKRNGLKMTIDNFGDFEAIYNKGGWFNTKEDANNHLKNLISDCSVVCLLLGEDSFKDKFLAEELEIAKELNKKRIAIQIEGVKKGIPEIWVKDGISVYSDDADELKRALESLTMWITA